MRINQQTAEILKRLNSGEVITDLGQLDRTTCRVLKKLSDRGLVWKGKDFTFPKTKTCWAGANITEEEIGDRNVTFNDDYKAPFTVSVEEAPAATVFNVVDLAAYRAEAARAKALHSWE